MVQREDGSSYVWNHGDVWTAYAVVSGPTGSFGRPVSTQSADDQSQAASFEGGMISAQYGEAPVASGGRGSPIGLEMCQTVPHDVAAQPRR